jgi:hypothetical protein
MSSKYTSRIKAKPKRRKRRGGAMTEDGKDIYDTMRPIVGKRPARMARKAVNTVMNHSEGAMEAAGTAAEIGMMMGGAMTEDGRDMYHSVRPVFGKRPARMARKAVNTVMNHGEEAISTAMGVGELVGAMGGGMTEEGKDIYDSMRHVGKRPARMARKAVNTLVNHGETIANIATSFATEGMDEPAGGSLQDHHDKSKFIHRSFHNYHHAHHMVGSMSPYMHRGWRAVANVLSGGKPDPMFPHVKAHHFSDYEYSKHAKVPKAAYKDVAKSDRYSLMNALEDEHTDHKAGKSGAGLFHAVNSVAKASAHWGRK